MDNVRLPDVLGDFDGGAAEFAVALGVVRVITSSTAVKGVAVKVSRVVDKKVAHTGDHGAITDGGKPQAGTAHGNGDACGDNRFHLGAAIARKHDRDFVSERN